MDGRGVGQRAGLGGGCVDPEDQIDRPETVFRSRELPVRDEAAGLVDHFETTFRLADRWFKTAVLEHPKPMRIALRLLFGNLLFFSFFGAAILLQKTALEKTAAFKTAEQEIRSRPELTLLLNRFPRFDETEMSLDLRNPSGMSVMETTAGKGEQRNKVRVEMQLVEEPLRWEVMKIEIKPYPSDPES